MSKKYRAVAYTALAQNAHPEIRKFAMDHLQQRITDPSFLSLFIRNFQTGDEKLLLANLRIGEDLDECHFVMMDVLKILEENPMADCQALALRAYRETPCASCRFRAAQLLITRNLAPASLIEECQWDSYSETRELAAKTAFKT